MSFDVITEGEAWPDGLLAPLVERAQAAFYRHFELDAKICEGAVLGCDDAKIAALNEDFRGKPTPTNVLSWPAEERGTPGKHPPLPAPDQMGEITLGDIAISYETCARESEASGKPFEEHATHLILHAMLHLLGFDHITDADAAIMEDCERVILETMGIADPY